MNIKEAILKEHSKRQTMLIVNYIGNDKKRFKELIGIFLKGEYRVTQRASWAVSCCSIAHPSLIKPFLKKMMVKLQEPGVHDAVKRNIIKILSEIEIPSELSGEIYERCFGYIRSADEPIAVKAHSITVLEKICMKYPDLKEELIMAIQDLIIFGSSGIVARGNKVLKNLRKH